MIYYNGASGGLGRHLGPLLRDHGVTHRCLSTRLEKAAELPRELATDPPRPGAPVTLVHLAAMVSVPRCEADPKTARAINVDRAIDYVEAFVRWFQARGDDPSVVYVSTGHVYAAPEQGRLLRESSPIEPRSVYALTKREGELALSDLAHQLPFRLIIARVFGLIAPSQPRHYVLPGLIERVRRGDVVGIAGLSNTRDYLDARDVVRHLYQLARWSRFLTASTAETVNVCSGEGTLIRELVDSIIWVVHELDTERANAISAAVTEAPGRPSDLKWLVGSTKKLKKLSPGPPRSISVVTTIRDAVAAL